jgi:hypothetical protein
VLLIFAVVTYRSQSTFITADGTIKTGYLVLHLLVWSVVLAFVYRYIVYPNKRHEYLLKNGIKSNAKILHKKVKFFLNRYPVLEFQLEIFNQTESPYLVKTKAMIVQRDFKYFEDGTTHKVCINPNDKNDVIIVHKYASAPQFHLFSSRGNR